MEFDLVFVVKSKNALVKFSLNPIIGRPTTVPSFILGLFFADEKKGIFTLVYKMITPHSIQNLLATPSILHGPMMLAYSGVRSSP